MAIAPQMPPVCRTVTVCWRGWAVNSKARQNTIDQTICGTCAPRVAHQPLWPYPKRQRMEPAQLLRDEVRLMWKRQQAQRQQVSRLASSYWRGCQSLSSPQNSFQLAPRSCCTR